MSWNSLKQSCLECFQWSEIEYDLQHIRRTGRCACLVTKSFLDKLELDADEIVNMKMKQNEAKYPVDKAKRKCNEIY